jgi:hypothetical protein
MVKWLKRSIALKHASHFRNCVTGSLTSDVTGKALSGGFREIFINRKAKSGLTPRATEARTGVCHPHHAAAPKLTFWKKSRISQFDR